MLLINDAVKIFNQDTVNEKTALENISLHLPAGEYTTIIGGNGSGKSTLLNCIAGVYGLNRGSITISGEDVSKIPEYRRARFLGRVFQDPMVGTAAKMSVEENLALALRRGKRRSLAWGIRRQERAFFQDVLSGLGLGIENRLSAQVGVLSGGQRQALSLLMATVTQPSLLLLDEHTAALDPKTAAKVLELTDRLVRENKLTALMVTHNMQDAISHGNRLLMMHEGTLVFDIKGESKQKLTVDLLLRRFSKAYGDTFVSEAALLAN